MRKNDSKAGELVNTLNRIKTAIEKGETDVLSEHPTMEELRLASQFLLGDFKTRFAGRPDGIVIESFSPAGRGGFITQPAPSSVIPILKFNSQPDLIGESWYVELDEAKQALPDMLQPVMWWRHVGAEGTAAKRVFGTDEVWGMGCTNKPRMTAVLSLAKERIQALGALHQPFPFIRWATLGAYRRAYRVWR